MRTSVKESVHTRPETIGVGYLHHCIPAHQKYFQRLQELGAPLDMMEYLAAHFAYDPGYLGEINEFTAGLPSTLHSYEYMLGSVERPPADVVDRLQHMARVSHCQWIGEHIGMMGTADTYSGTFLQPLGTDEQTQQFIDNLRAATARSVCPLIVENQPQVFNQIGPRGVCQQVADVAVGADVGILLSLSNIIMSDDFHPMDRDAELASLPLDRVWQVHIPVPCERELDAPGLAKPKQDTHWAYSTLEELFAHPDFRPVSVILEVEAVGTLSRAEPEQTRDRLVWARELLGLGAKV
jgi:uncharacterized protein (UPF0276 family)